LSPKEELSRRFTNTKRLPERPCVRPHSRGGSFGDSLPSTGDPLRPRSLRLSRRTLRIAPVQLCKPECTARPRVIEKPRKNAKLCYRRSREVSPLIQVGS